MREYHVRFCERLEGKFLRSTHLNQKVTEVGVRFLECFTRGQNTSRSTAGA
jgi:hypothetical protein